MQNDQWYEIDCYGETDQHVYFVISFDIKAKRLRCDILKKYILYTHVLILTSN